MPADQREHVPSAPGRAAAGAGGEGGGDAIDRREFEEVLLGGGNCVFVNYDGAVLPW